MISAYNYTLLSYPTPTPAHSSSSSSSIIVRPLSRITTMAGVHTAQGVWRSCVWNAVTVSALTPASGRDFHSGTVLTKNECLYWAVFDRICLNLKLRWCLVLGSAGSKIASACTGMLYLTILKSMASRISRLRSLRGAQFRSFSNEDIFTFFVGFRQNWSSSSRTAWGSCPFCSMGTLIIVSQCGIIALTVFTRYGGPRCWRVHNAAEFMWASAVLVLHGGQCSWNGEPI